jgi:hypothetical protein
MDIEAILEMYEDDYNPSSKVPGPRNMYGDGGITEGKGANKGTFYLRIPNEDGVRINHSGTKFQMEQLLKKYKERLKVKKIPSNKLTTDQSKIVLEWGKNKSKALGETWSDKKTLKEYNNLSEDMRTKVRSKKVTGTGGSWAEGQIKPLTTEQQKLWNATMADEFGKWEDYPEADRNRWRSDFPRKQQIYSQTKDLLNIDELAEYLGKEFDTDISRNKIKGRFGSEGRTALGQYIDDNLFVDSFGSIKGNIEGEVRGNVSYYKKPTQTQINQIKKQNLVFDTRTNTLRPKTLKNIKTLNEMYGDAYRSGTIPKLQDIMNATGLSEGEIAKAEARLAQIYNGHKFRNGPDDIRVNKNAASKLFNFMSKAQFGNPRKNELYNISLDLIDEGLGNEKNTFNNLKDKARKILKENGIKVYSTKSPIGFNIDELAGVTGSAKSKNMAVSQFINVIEGNLNQTTLQNFQSSLSRARSAVEAAKGTPRYNSVLKKQMELINTRAAKLEKDFGIKLARLERPADINNMSKNEVKRLKNIKLGTGENLYQRLVKDAKASGYSVKMPKDTLTIQEFVDPKNADQVRTMLADLGCPKSLQKASGGRIMYGKGTTCAAKGREVIEKGLKNGFKNKNQQVLAEGILKSGRFLKDAVSLRGLFGPAALAFTAAAEAGIVGYDMLASGKSFREAVGDSIFNYALGDKTKIDSDEEFIKRLRNIKVGPQGYQRMGEAEIGKMMAFKSALDDINYGGDLYKQLNTITENRKQIDSNPEDAFNQNAFQLDLDRQEDKVRADIRDFNKVGTPDKLLGVDYEGGAKATELANLLVKQDQLKNAGTAGVLPKIDEGVARNLKQTKYGIENLFKGPTGYEGAVPSEMSYIMSKIKNEPDNNYGLFGPAQFMEGGIASLNVNKK